MATKSLNVFLFLLLLVVVGLTWGVQQDPTERYPNFIPEMVTSVPYNPFSENSNFADGMTMRQPVVGTISRSHLPLHYEANETDAKRAGEELVNPFHDSVQAVADRGTAVFVSMCQSCHGATALGDGAVTRYGFPPPPSLLVEKAMKLKDGQIFHILTYGQGNMPSLASQMSREDRWKVITRVRAMQNMELKRVAAEKQKLAAVAQKPIVK